MKDKSPINEMSAALIIVIFWIAFILLTFSISTHAATYEFKYKKNMTVTVEGSDNYTAMRKAAMICYRTLTNNVYPGEDRGLDIIDVCSNPINIEKAEVNAKKKK